MHFQHAILQMNILCAMQLLPHHTQRVDIKYKDAAISEALTQTKTMHFKNIHANQKKKNVIAKCDHASSPKQFCKSYKMVTVNYGHIRFGYRNSSIRIRIIRRLNFCKCILHSLAIYELQKKNVPFDVLFFDLGKHCTAAQPNWPFNQKPSNKSHILDIFHQLFFSSLFLLLLLL